MTLRARECAWPGMTNFAELDEMIRRGWGDVPQTQIPSNWRESEPHPRACGRPRRREGEDAGRSRQERLDRVAAAMREKNLGNARKKLAARMQRARAGRWARFGGSGVAENGKELL